MTILIKNIILVDGTGMSPYKADVLVRDKKIMAVGSFPNYKADEIINGNEGYLVPGFIDMDITSDRYLTLFEYPEHKNFLIQGITSGLMGQCGFSLAPNFYGSLRYFSGWTNINHFNVGWHNVKEFLDVIKRLSPGINIGTLVGHRVIREDIMKNINDRFRRLSSNELRIFESVVENAMKQGAFGLSSGLEYGEYKNTSHNELKSIIDVVKNYGGIYETHLRNEREAIVESVEESIKMSKETLVPTIFTHLRAFKGYEKQYEKAMDIIKNETVNADIYFNINPFTMSATQIGTLLGDVESNFEAVVERITDKKFAKELSTKLPRVDGHKIIILNAPGMNFLNGKTLYAFAKNRGISINMAIIKLAEITKMRATILYNNLDKKMIDKALMHERSLISTNSNNFDNINDINIPKRATDSFPEFLRIANRHNLNIEIAISKITGLPAKILGLDNRGYIKGGAFADMVLLSKDINVVSVMVNGSWAVKDGELIGKPSSGSALKFMKIKR